MDPHQLHVVLFPFVTAGHLTPTLDMAKLFSSRGLKTTLVVTRLNHSPALSRIVEKSCHSGNKIELRLLHLPEGRFESSHDHFTTLDSLVGFVNSLSLLQEQLEQILQERSPDCLVADMFFPWATDSAARFGIPRLVFSGQGIFQLCVSENLRFYKPFMNVSSDTEPFVLPDFPHEIRYAKGQVLEFELGGGSRELEEMLTRVRESESRSFGIVVNSFKQLEGDYVDYLAKAWKKRAWLIGPLLLWRGNESSSSSSSPSPSSSSSSSTDGEHECLKWLDSKKCNSVIYLCFGTQVPLPDPQLHEIALGLEASGHPFIWVVNNNRKDDDRADEERSSSLPQGFEQRVGDRGLIVRGWAPQVSILGHEATGGFVTHCGWNSTLEAVCAGVPMVTWPIHAEQPMNEKLLTQVLKIGVPVGSPWLNKATSLVKREEVADAVKRVMGDGEEAAEMRSRAKALKGMANKAVEEGGSSYNELCSLIEQVRAFRSQSKKI